MHVSEMNNEQSSSTTENSTTDETGSMAASRLKENCQSRLSQDFLRMFLEEIATDVVVKVPGRLIKAHKCILSLRSAYFAEIIIGGQEERAGNVIELSFSSEVVHFALCHIYSGESTIPDSMDIIELTDLADKLGLEGLTEAITFTLTAKFCHHFHRPCAVCTKGVILSLSLSSHNGLKDLHKKCLKWIAKYFSSVWPTINFATLPTELLSKCYLQIALNFNIETIVDIPYGCGIIVETMQNRPWAEVVVRLCRKLLLAAANYIALKLTRVLRDIGTLPPDPPAGALNGLNECIAAAIDKASPDECCRAYALLSAAGPIVTDGISNNVPGQDNLLYVHAPSWILQCEGALVRAGPSVFCTQAFIDLPHELRLWLQELGDFKYPARHRMSQVFQNRRSQSTHHTESDKTVNQKFLSLFRSLKTQNSSTTKSLDIDQMRASFVPDAPKPMTTKSDTLKSNVSLHDPTKVCPTIPPKVRTTKAQEERDKALSQDSLATGSRPRSSEPSTDSHSESQTSNKYATYTKTKHTSKESIDETVKARGAVYVHESDCDQLEDWD